MIWENLQEESKKEKRYSKGDAVSYRHLKRQAMVHLSVIFPSVISRYLQQRDLTVNKCQYIKYCMWLWAQAPVMTRRVAFGTEMFGVNSIIT